ncbi:hypothetical protein ACK1KB_10505 [Chryseobacterium sp. TY3]
MNKYILLAVVVVFVSFFTSFFLPAGGVYRDSLSYFEIAADLPNPVTDLFPLGYPILVRGFQLLFGDYFWAYKMLNVTMLIIVFLFSYLKQFYFRETVLLFMGKTMLFVFSIALSEAPFLFLMYFLIYFLHKILIDKTYSKTDVIIASVIMVMMFIVRYSGIYIYLAIGVFAMYLLIKSNNREVFWSFVLFLIISGLGIASYLGYNYYNYKSYTGEDLRGAPYPMTGVSLLRNILGVINAANPFFGVKPASSSVVSIGFQIVVAIVDIFILRYFILIFKKSRSRSDHNFYILLWIISGVYAISLLLSGWTQQIEEMNTRMMAAANVCLFFSFLIIYFKNESSDKKLLRVSVLFLIFFLLYTLKSPEYYFYNRKQVEQQMSKFSSKRFIYDDIEEETTLTTYRFLFINKAFHYKHSNNQNGDIKRQIAGTLDPKKKWLMHDTVTDKSKVLYTSQIKLNQNKKPQKTDEQ